MRKILAIVLVLLIVLAPASVLADNNGQGRGDPHDQPGPAGPPGPQGEVGPVGPIGPQGPAGSQGPVGQVGLQGLAGPAGGAGTTGSQGPAGPSGPAGFTGATGATGPIGPQGLTGPTGTPGSTWHIGSEQPQPSLGRDNDLYLQKNGNIWQRSAGTWMLFTNLTGAQGPTGVAGPQGLQGTKEKSVDTSGIAQPNAEDRSSWWKWILIWALLMSVAFVSLLLGRWTAGSGKN